MHFPTTPSCDLPSPRSSSLIAALLLGWIFLSVLTPSPAWWIDFIIRQWDFSVPAHPHPPRGALLAILFLSGIFQQRSCFWRVLGSAAKYQRNNSDVRAQVGEKGQWALCAFQHINSPTGLSVPARHSLGAQSFPRPVLRAGMKSLLCCYSRSEIKWE